MGPHINQSELDPVLKYINVAHEDGVILDTGGNELAGEAYDDGFFVDPVKDNQP